MRGLKGRVRWRGGGGVIENKKLEEGVKRKKE